MKNNNEVKLSFEEYKQQINNLIATKQIDKLKLQENYFEICNNFWIVDKYIAKDGVFDPSLTPNTLSTYDSAIKENYALLIPVQMLDDGNIVCFRHQNISKVVEGADGYLRKCTIKELKDISLNDIGEKIPTLDEALSYIADRTEIIIEIINDSTTEKFESKVLLSIQKYIEKYNCYNRVAIMSINPYSLEYCYETYPYITRILKSGIFSDRMYGSFKTKKLKKLKYYKITHADFISYSFELLPSSNVEKHKPVGILAHTITNQNQYPPIAEHCDNIIFSNFKPTI